MVTRGGRIPRAEQVGATRQQILTAAERLFAEQGLYAVSNRRISAAAGQGNNTAAGLVDAVTGLWTAPVTHS
ncbi:TetR family transcriptional regulator [Streptomyces sp. NPDC059506]|uniref:TetR family transcriptional regulator n=1 Tax=Streptomyces sp. NPDC059506 TaxID=3347751 RepID=UPI0036855134